MLCMWQTSSSLSRVSVCIVSWVFVDGSTSWCGVIRCKYWIGYEMHWTYKMPVRYILSSVWVRFNIFYQLSIIQYVGLCVFSLPISLVMIEIIYKLCLIIIIKSEVWTITHCLGLGHETMVCAVCLSTFLCNRALHCAFVHKGNQSTFSLSSVVDFIEKCLVTSW